MTFVRYSLVFLGNQFFVVPAILIFATGILSEFLGVYLETCKKSWVILFSF